MRKAVNGFEAISQELARLGLDVVSAENVGRRAMSCALVELESKIASSDTALIYFAGHGFAFDGTNYLLPVDLPAAGPGEEVLVRDDSFAANGLSDRLQEKGVATAIPDSRSLPRQSVPTVENAQRWAHARAHSRGSRRMRVQAAALRCRRSERSV